MDTPSSLSALFNSKPFFLKEIKSAGSGDKNTVVFSWGERKLGFEYSVCINNKEDYNHCESIGMVTSKNEIIVDMGPLFKHWNKEYYIQAKKPFSNAIVNSNIVEIQPDVITGLITYLKASNANKEDLFGTAIEISHDGKLIAIGAPQASSNVNDPKGIHSGAVYIYELINGTWAQTHFLASSDPNANDLFGHSLSFNKKANTLVVGAPGYTLNVNHPSLAPSLNAGAAYVFKLNKNKWQQSASFYVPKMNSIDAPEYDKFGYSVSLSDDGNTLSVGSPGQHSFNEYNNAGAVYMYRYTSKWSAPVMLKSPHGASFGEIVSISGDGRVLAVSSHGEGDMTEDQSPLDSGAAYVFGLDIDTNIWSEKARLKASNPGERMYFGSSLSLSADGTTLAIGSEFEKSTTTEPDNTQGINIGAAYIFHFDDPQWTQQAYLKPTVMKNFMNFAHALSLSDDGAQLIVGAIGDNKRGVGIYADGTLLNTTSKYEIGGAFYFEKAGDTWTQKAYLKPKEIDEAGLQTNNDYFGARVMLSGNGAVLAISDPDEDGDKECSKDLTSSGAVYIY